MKWVRMEGTLALDLPAPRGADGACACQARRGLHDGCGAQLPRKARQARRHERGRAWWACPRRCGARTRPVRRGGRAAWETEDGWGEGAPFYRRGGTMGPCPEVGPVGRPALHGYMAAGGLGPWLRAHRRGACVRMRRGAWVWFGCRGFPTGVGVRAEGRGWCVGSAWFPTRRPLDRL